MQGNGFRCHNMLMQLTIVLKQGMANVAHQLSPQQSGFLLLLLLPLARLVVHFP